MRLLHIEKDELFSKQVKKIVEDNGFIYLNIDSFEEAQRILSEMEIHLLITANRIDDEDCDSFIEKIKISESSQIPVIVISEEEDFEQKSHYFKMGVMAYLNKDEFELKRLDKYIQTIKRELELIQYLRGLKIAVVDDSSFSLGVIRSFFDSYKVKNVEYFQDSYEFGKNVENIKNYDMFIIDYVMPVFDGEYLILKIREENLDSMIILVTSNGDEKTITHCLSIGADDFILKPLEVKLFMLRVISCLRQFKLNQENMNKSKVLFEMATRDSLTGVYNRNYFINTYGHKVAESLRSGQPFSLILLDIDHFKEINDRYGHLKGDYVLKEIAGLLKHNLRESDIICRWGGEEFIILCVNTDLRKAVIVAEKLRSSIEEYRFKSVKRVTASIGVTQWKLGDDKDSAFKRIDNSLYLAKLTGRNKVVSNEELQIVKDGLPVNIEWGPFFISGHPKLDLEHYEMIRLSNEIIQNCFVEGSDATVIQLFSKLITETAEHFRNEEELLRSLAYEKLEEHIDIHKELITKANLVQKELIAGTIKPIDVARYLIQDVVVGHIIKNDFDFFYIFNDK
ncbi:MAG: diguanylate cyclase [Proteocatella sp.]